MLFLTRPPPPIADTYSMFGVTINNDDAIIQSLESQVTFKETAQLLSLEIFGLHLSLTFAGNKEALLNKRYRSKEGITKIEPFYPGQLSRPDRHLD